MYCYVHLFGDFGNRGLPGTFKIFLVDVVVQMARSELVLTLPLAIYVDDSGLIGSANDGAGASEKRVGSRAARARAEVPEMGQSVIKWMQRLLSFMIGQRR